MTRDLSHYLTIVKPTHIPALTSRWRHCSWSIAGASPPRWWTSSSRRRRRWGRAAGAAAGCWWAWARCSTAGWWRSPGCRNTRGPRSPGVHLRSLRSLVLLVSHYHNSVRGIFLFTNNVVWLLIGHKHSISHKSNPLIVTIIEIESQPSEKNNNMSV